jgi:general secretion pathway protein K
VRPDAGPKPTGSERGWALVSVLWTIAVLAMLAAAAQSLSFNAGLIEQRELDDTRMDAVFDAAVARAVLGLGDARLERRWRVDGVPRTFTFGGHALRIAVQDEVGRIDLNAADGSLVRQLLRSAGVAESDAATLTDRILDWRGHDAGLSRLHGGTDALYANAGLAYRPRHDAFQSVDELRLVLGMTPALFARIRPALTVYSHQPAIDTAIAPREALSAYYPDQPDRVADMWKARESATAAKPGVIASPNDLTGRTFDITVAAAVRQRTIHREAVVMLTRDPAKPYLVLLWR